MLEFEIKDMTCGHCEARIRKALTAAEPTVQISVDMLNRRVRMTGIDPLRALAAIGAAGYTPNAIASTSTAAVNSAR